MKRAFYYNGEDFNKISPTERRMLSRVMKLKSKKNPVINDISNPTEDMNITDIS